MSQPKQTKPKTVKVPDSSYQPSRAELRDDLRLKGTFEDAVKALVKPVNVQRMMPPKGR